MPYKRVLIIANKDWEATALTNVLLDAKACPDTFPWPVKLTHPLPPHIESTNSKPKPRAVFHFQERSHGKTHDVQVEIWCVQDAMDPSVSSSSTKEKDEVLAVMYFGGKVEVDTDKEPDFVVAFGTAGFPGETSYNGCVFVGAVSNRKPRSYLSQASRTASGISIWKWHHVPTRKTSLVRTMLGWLQRGSFPGSFVT